MARILASIGRSTLNSNMNQLAETALKLREGERVAKQQQFENQLAERELGVREEQLELKKQEVLEKQAELNRPISLDVLRQTAFENPKLASYAENILRGLEKSSGKVLIENVDGTEIVRGKTLLAMNELLSQPIHKMAMTNIMVQETTRQLFDANTELQEYRMKNPDVTVENDKKFADLVKRQKVSAALQSKYVESKDTLHKQKATLTKELVGKGVSAQTINDYWNDPLADSTKIAQELENAASQTKSLTDIQKATLAKTFTGESINEFEKTRKPESLIKLEKPEKEIGRLGEAAVLEELRNTALYDPEITTDMYDDYLELRKTEKLSREDALNQVKLMYMQRGQSEAEIDGTSETGDEDFSYLWK